MLEDQLARTFDQHRTARHLRHLQRIRDRNFLRQLACSAAATGTPTTAALAAEAQADGSLLALSVAEPPPAAFTRVADYDDRRSASGRKVARYSIAAFASPADPNQRWIAVALYWSRFTEWFAIRSGTYAHPAAGGVVTPACTGLR